MYSRRLVAIDPSLTCSGWALFALEPAQLIGVGKIRSLSPDFPLAERLLDLQLKITQTFKSLKLGNNDVLICEAPTTMRDPRAALKVEQVRTMFETLARGREIIVPGRLNPRSVQYEVMGLKGKQLERSMVKAVAVAVVESVYGPVMRSMGFDSNPKNLRSNQDIVDAVLIGSLALTRVKSAESLGLPLSEIFDREHNRRKSISRLSRQIKCAR